MLRFERIMQILDGATIGLNMFGYNSDISQSHAANHHELLRHVTLCLVECSK